MTTAPEEERPAWEECYRYVGDDGLVHTHLIMPIGDNHRIWACRRPPHDIVAPGTLLTCLVCLAQGVAREAMA